MDGNLAMANAYVNQTEEQVNYWADVQYVFEQMDRATCKYPLPMAFNETDERAELLRRERRLKSIAERYVRIKWYQQTAPATE